MSPGKKKIRQELLRSLKRLTQDDGAPSELTLAKALPQARWVRLAKATRAALSPGRRSPARRLFPRAAAYAGVALSLILVVFTQTPRAPQKPDVALEVLEEMDLLENMDLLEDWDMLASFSNEELAAL